MAKTWEVYPKKTDDLFEQLLINREIKSKKDQDDFLNPKLEDYAGELNLSGIDTAKKRIEKAVKDKELVIVYGDYDADGLCGTAVLYQGLTYLGAKVLPYIPHRDKEGYGLSKEGLDIVKEKGATLVITVDNGIVATDQAKYASDLGLDLIITDHHAIEDKKPDALAIIHSTKICGAAVAWCLVRAITNKKEADELLDLVAIATVCDLLPLLGINRALVKYGLQQLRQTKRLGLLALFNESKLKKGEITSRDISHVLGPRLNAIGRLEHSMDALRLLCTKDRMKALRLAQVLVTSNELKKKVSQDGITEAHDLISKQVDALSKKILILHSENWIPGITGLIAGRISEEYSLPTIAIARGESIARGSARSVGELNIVEVIRECSDCLIDMGGHPGAAGFTIENSKITEFQDRLEELMVKVEFSSVPKLLIDAEIPVKMVNKKLVSDLDRLEPTGISNVTPVFASLNVSVTDVKTLSDGQHLKFRAEGIDAIAFSFGNLASLIKEGQLVNLAYTLEINKFNGSEKVQLKIIDIQLN